MSTTMRPLGEIARALYGAALREPDRDQDGSFPVFGSSGVVGRHSKTLVDMPTIVIGRKGSVGAVTYAPAGGWPIDTAFYLELLRPDESDLRYLYHALSAANLDKHEITTSIPGLNRDRLLETNLYFPSVAEQRRLAAILDKADAIRRKRREALKLADEFLRAAFLDFFGDPVANPKNWDQRTLEQVVRPGTSITYGIVQAGPHVEDGIPYIRTGDFKNGELQSHGLGRTALEIAVKFQRSRVEEGDLVYCIRASIGSVDVVPRELDGANLTQGTARIACGEKINNEFLKWQLRTSQFGAWIDRHSKGATFKEITLETLRNAPVIVPPPSLQQKFVSMVQANDKLIRRQRVQLDAASDCFSSLSHRAFQGTL